MEWPSTWGDYGDIRRSWNRYNRRDGGSGGVILAHADLSISQHREVFAAQSVRPLKAKLVHKSLAALLGPLTNRSAWRNGLFQNCTNRRIHGTQEEFQLWRALYLHERVKLVHFEPCVLLVGMTH